MEPHGVVKAGHLNRSICPCQPVGQQRGIEQSHIAGIGNDARVQHVVIWQCAVSPNPYALAGHRVSLTAKRVSVGIALINRSWPVVPFAEFFLVGLHARFEIGKRLGLGRIFHHGNLMFQTFFVLLEAGMQIENVFTVLNGNDAAS